MVRTRTLKPQPTDLCRIMAKHGSDKSPLWKGNRKPHDYTLLYDELFSKWRKGARVDVLECGIYDGASLRGWRDYFSEGLIVGLDIAHHRLVQESRIVSVTCDQIKPAEVIQALWGVGQAVYKIIIDDGYHVPSAAITFFTEAFPYLAKDGYYVVEDVKPKHLEATVAGMKASHPEARITVYDRRHPGSKYDNILVIATHD